MACYPYERLPKSTLLAMLESQIDTSRVIIVGTGEVLETNYFSQHFINSKIKNGTWVYYEKLQPRRMMVSNPDWTITSFDPFSRMVCVQLFTNSGMRMLNFTLPNLSNK